MSDHPDFAAAKSYGVFNEKFKMAVRSYFLIGADGRIKWKNIEGVYLPTDEVIESLRTALG